MRLLTFIITLSFSVCIAQHLYAQAPAKTNPPDTITRETEPDPNDFVDIDEEPQPVVPFESLIEYPEAAKKAGIEGKVTIEALVGKDGRVQKVQVYKSDNDLLEAEAVRVMKAARFTPAKQSGKPVMVWITRTINFKLGTGNDGNKYDADDPSSGHAGKKF